jgi:hypothetical protein
LMGFQFVQSTWRRINSAFLRSNRLNNLYQNDKTLDGYQRLLNDILPKKLFYQQN